MIFYNDFFLLRHVDLEIMGFRLHLKNAGLTQKFIQEDFKGIFGFRMKFSWKADFEQGYSVELREEEGRNGGKD